MSRRPLLRDLLCKPTLTKHQGGCLPEAHALVGREQGEHPILTRKESVLAEKSFEEAHTLTIHGGVTLTMANIK